MALAGETLARLKTLLGPKGWTEDPAIIAPHLVEWRERYRGTAALMVMPATVDEVAAVVEACHDSATPIVPQGGNTGLVGGQIPFGGEVLVSLARLNRVRDLDAANNTVTAEAGCILADVQRAAHGAGRLFPVSLASEGSCTIGGIISTNAGGTAVLRYGNTRSHVLGLEVVLPDGTVWDGLRGLRKDNTGYDLKQLFIGAEGTLGVVTAAVLALAPRPAHRTVAFVALDTPGDSIRLLNALRDEAGETVSAFELVPQIGMAFLTAHLPGARDPFPAPHPWYVLVELAGEAALGATLERVLAAHTGLRDAVIAQSEAQADALWALREALSEVQKHEGGSIKCDVAVPVSAIPEFIAQASAAVVQACPGVRPVIFGHVGDGNLHFNLTQPKNMTRESFLARWDALSTIVHRCAAAFGGSISAEHGLGVMKRDEITHYKSATEIALMRSIKATLDPKNIMNPGKVVTATHR